MKAELTTAESLKKRINADNVEMRRAADIAHSTEEEWGSLQVAVNIARSRQRSSHGSTDSGFLLRVPPQCRLHCALPD